MDKIKEWLFGPTCPEWWTGLPRDGCNTICDKYNKAIELSIRDLSKSLKCQYCDTLSNNEFNCSNCGAPKES